MAELNTDLVSDVLGIADDSLEQLADALIGGDAADVADAVVVDVRGTVGDHRRDQPRRREQPARTGGDLL